MQVRRFCEALVLCVCSMLVSVARGKAYGITYSLLMPGDVGTRCATKQEVQADVELLSQVAKNVRLFDFNCLEQQKVIWEAASQGKFGLYTGIWMSSNKQDIENQKANIVELLNLYPTANVVGIGCGNEVLLAGLMPLDDLINECAQVADLISAAGRSIPMSFVGEIDTYFNLPEDQKQKILDFFPTLGFNSHQFYKHGGLDDVPADRVGPEATDAVLRKYAEAVKQTEKEVVLAEIGYPSSTSAEDSVTYNTANPQMQATVVCDWVNSDKTRNIKYYIHELRDADWKLGTIRQDPSSTDLFWGMFDTSLQPKPVVSQCLIANQDPTSSQPPSAIPLLINTREELTNTREPLTTAREALINTREALLNSREPLSTAREALSNTREALSNTREALTNTRETLTNTREALTNPHEALTNTHEALSPPSQPRAEVADILNQVKDSLSVGQGGLGGSIRSQLGTSMRNQLQSILQVQSAKLLGGQHAAESLHEPESLPDPRASFLSDVLGP